jgi:hypothetical protein
MMILDVQPKWLPDLQPLRTRLLLDLEPASSPISESITHAFPPRPIHAAEDLKPLWGAGLEDIQVLV